MVGMSKEETAHAKKCVKYRAPFVFSARLITASDWGSIGIDMPDVAWNAENAWTVPIDVFTAEALAYVETDNTLSIE